MQDHTTRQSWIAWLIVSLFSIGQFFLQISGNMIAKPLMHDFHLNATQLGAMNAAFFLGYVVVQFPGGMLYDRYQLRRVCIIATLACAIGCIGFALAHSWWFAIAMRLLIGVGSGFAFIGMVYVSAQWFPARLFALLVGLGEFLALAGTAVGQQFAPWLVMAQGWRTLMLIMSGVMFILLLCMWCYLKDKPSDRKTAEPLLKAMWRDLTKTITYRAVWISGLYCLSMFGVITGFVALWGIPFLEHVQQLPFLSATTLMVYALISIAIGGPVIGWLNGFVHHPKFIMLVSGSIALLGMLSIIILPLGFWALAVILFITGFFSSAYVLGFAVVNLSLPAEIVGAGIGLCNTIALTGAVIFQPATGAIIDFFAHHHLSMTVGYQLGVGLLPVAMILALLGVATLKRAH